MADGAFHRSVGLYGNRELVVSVSEAFYFLLGWVLSNVFDTVAAWWIRRYRSRQPSLGLLVSEDEVTEEELEELRQIEMLQKVLATGEKPEGVP